MTAQITAPHDALFPLLGRQIDFWVDYACTNAGAGANFEAVCNGINDFMALRSYLVGNDLSVADLALWGALQRE